MVKLSTTFLLLAVGIQSVLGAPTTSPAGANSTLQKRAKCANVRVRKEWRDLTVDERIDYTRAVKCLMETPSTATREGVVSRFDEFQACHIDLTNQVHQVGHFLAWHRHFLTLYANAMRDECGYQGPATYWDWSRDADGPGLMADSPVFDPVTGFGGNGVPGTYTPPPNTNPGFPGFPQPTGTNPGFPGWPAPAPAPTTTGAPPGGGFPGFPGGGFPGFPEQGCVDTGPFSNITVNLGPGTAIGPHCLLRGINEGMKSSLTSANVDIVMQQTEFEVFRTVLENGGRGSAGMGIHGGGHGVVGGEMMDPFSSPADPLFYLHHGNLDRIWWKWQNADPENRMYAISGPTTQRPPFTQVTLDFVMPFTTLLKPGEEVTVRDVMETDGELGCFTYAD
ncbi:hypothetical protein CC1G_09997 [Coprinopsis cinerea okayama7|uniref:Tyrosinase copper-binding domain-containing protein n=1 Tax=Coprinopsis cinerea (strain Okayama-7 / 130 / ATCC MYA-4618 / FGSC 9003) TaxID=240176 RepID=A8NDI8_COPC7|nr:hypothetical protein CC1G_09997 [Coprinopsis cinerea okayama7\|eukprot:XP_001832783.1 hypothetical protein CC1G_09997 [Coprinopsis cinerea okayama7\